MSQKSKPCRFFQQGSCKFTEDQCRFSHQLNITTSQQIPSGKQDPARVLADKIKYVPPNKKKPNSTVNTGNTENRNSDEYGLEKAPHRRHKKNTESFEPNYEPADMRVLVEVAGKKKTTHLQFQSKDVVVVPDLFCSEEDLTIHQKLLDEMDRCGIDSDRLWKLWHGDTHLIADDHTRFKERCPTFLKILNRIEEYFGMEIKATRFNLYRDDNDFKPFHHDAAAIDPEKAKVQNMTVGVSFGRTREIAFQDAKEPQGHRRVVSFPLPNGYTYCFAKDINTTWRHGVSAIPEGKKTNQSRISLIAWGSVKQESV